MSTYESTKDYWAKLQKFNTLLQEAEAIVIGAGAGLSTSAGLVYTGERFKRNFSDFIKAYPLQDMYSAAFYPFPTSEILWAYWSRHIYHNRYAAQLNTTYPNLYRLMQNRNYFILTTNVDHQFIYNRFSKDRLFYTQGDYGLFQCSVPCHKKTYDNKSTIMQMVARQTNLKIPSELVPHCPRCGAEMTQNLRKDEKFVQDEGWYTAKHHYENFLNTHQNRNVLYLELGVGTNTPGIIQYPFWQFVHKNKKAHYINLNIQHPEIPHEIQKRSVLIQGDICHILQDLN